MISLTILAMACAGKINKTESKRRVSHVNFSFIDTKYGLMACLTEQQVIELKNELYFCRVGEDD